MLSSPGKLSREGVWTTSRLKSSRLAAGNHEPRSCGAQVTEPREPPRRATKHRCLLSVPLDCALTGREVNMPGVDFDILRADVSMEQVLNQLNFDPTSRSGSQWHGPCLVHGSTSSGSRSFFGQSRYRPLLLPQVPKPWKRFGALGRGAQAQHLRSSVGSLSGPGPRRPLDQSLVKTDKEQKRRRTGTSQTLREPYQAGGFKHFDCP